MRATCCRTAAVCRSPRRALATMGHGASTFYDPYTLLGVRRGCSEVELKKAYGRADGAYFAPSSALAASASQPALGQIQTGGAPPEFARAMEFAQAADQHVR